MSDESELDRLMAQRRGELKPRDPTSKALMESMERVAKLTAERDQALAEVERLKGQETPCPARADSTHCVHWYDDDGPCCGCGDDSNSNRKEPTMGTKRTETIENTKQAVASGWQVVGHPDVWELVCKATNKDLGIMKSTKRMKVKNGYVYQVTTETMHGCAEALVYVPVRWA